MRCNECDRYLQQYADGELAESRREMVDAHLSNCPSCRNKLAAYCESKRALECLKEEPGMPGFVEGVMSKIKAREAGVGASTATPASYHASAWFNWKFLVAGAVTVAAVILALTLPFTMKPSQAKLAANIALASPIVQAAFGTPMSTITVQNVILNDGQAVVILRRGDAAMVMAGVDMTLKEVTQCAVVDHPISGI